MIRILLSAGHGEGKAHNRGSVCSNEGDNNFYYTLALQKELLTYKGVTVDLIRKKISDNPSIGERAKMGKGYDLYLSSHSNAGDGSIRGTEIFDSVERPNRALATNLCGLTAKFFDHKNRGVKYREGKAGFNYYGELRYNEAKSAMIIENGFHTNSLDCKIYATKHKELAQIQAKAIAEFYNLSKNTTKEDLSKPSPWAREDWEKAISLGLTDGSKPRELITREQMVSLTSRTMDLIEKQKLNKKQLVVNSPVVNYSDKPSQWAKADWEWGIGAKITDGSRPKDKLTREQFISMLIRYYKGIGGK